MTPNTKIAKRFTLPGGLEAIAVWRKGTSEGVISADTTWQANNPPGSRAFETAEARAAQAVGTGDETEWCWEPAELRDGKPAYA